MQRQVLQSCVDPLGWCLSFSSSTEWTVYEMACFLCFPLLCTETGTHSAFLLAGFGVLQYIDTVVDVGDAVALWRLVKEFYIYSPCCSRCSPAFWTLFPELLVSGSHLPLCVATVHGCSWSNFVFFYVKSGLGSFCSSHLEIWNYFYEHYLAVAACVSPRCFWKNFTYFHRVCCPGFPAQFALENMDFIFTFSHMAVGRVFLAALTHFSRSSGLSRS